MAAREHRGARPKPFSEESSYIAAVSHRLVVAGDKVTAPEIRAARSQPAAGKGGPTVERRLEVAA